MPSYDYAQLEKLWTDAGGPASEAAYAAAIADAESGGDPLAAYPGTTVAPGQGSWTDATGIWQILGEPSQGGWSAADLTNPADNAKMAVEKFQAAGDSFSPWQTWTQGSWEQFYQDDVPPAKSVPDDPTGSAPAGGGGGVVTTSAAGPLGGLIAQGGGVLHGAALMLDRFLAMGAPGQGWRLVFGAGAILAGAGAFRAYTGSSIGPVGETASNLPMAIGLTGVASISAFMTLRPWPQTSAGAIQPGAYLVDVLKGEPPPGGPQSITPTEVDLTEGFLGTLLALWAAAKAAKAGSWLSNLLPQGSGEGGGEGETPPEEPPGGGEPPEVPPVDPVL